METEDLQSYDLEALLQLLSAELEEADTHPIHGTLLVRTALAGMPLLTAGLPDLDKSLKPNIFLLHILRCAISNCCYIRYPTDGALLTAIETAQSSLHKISEAEHVWLSGTSETFHLIDDISLSLTAAYSSPVTYSALESFLRSFAEDTYKDELKRILGDLTGLPREPYELFGRRIESTFSTLDWRRKLSHPSWSFWRDWYQSFLDGKPLDWEIQRRVAKIEYWVWDAGPQAVADEIERIQAEWLAEQLPQADRVNFDSTTGLFFSQQVPLNAVGLVETTLKQVEFARSVAANSNCGFNSNSTSWMYIEFTLDSCRDDANAIEQNLEIARQDIIEGFKDNTYQPDAKLTALEQVLDRAVTDLRAHHPDVAEAWEARIKHKLKLAKAEQKQLIVEKATELIVVSQEKLGAEFQLDAKTISETSGEVQSGAIRRFFGRVAQMRIVVRSSEVVKRIDASSGYKGTRIVQTLQSLIDLIIGVWPG
ncbi:MAG: hypothetical protein HWE35_13875 [Rhodobacteraceae bacterium]|nr:hypothetical protein [Paracoccaceae bacterium]